MYIVYMYLYACVCSVGYNLILSLFCFLYYFSFGHWEFLQIISLSVQHALVIFWITFWNHMMFQAHLVFSLPQPQTQLFFQGSMLLFIEQYVVIQALICSLWLWYIHLYIHTLMHLHQSIIKSWLYMDTSNSSQRTQDCVTSLTMRNVTFIV